jgi:beta-lactamase superfamily II metal-dependent hydrolase
VIQTHPPDPDTAEISLFGPDVGECIVIHYGDNRWFIVDSCLLPGSQVSIALKYLESLGVDVATQVTGLLLSHWHSDHIEGAYRLVSACENAVIHASAALFSSEAVNLAALYKNDPFSDTDKEIREFRDIVEHLKAQGQPERFDLVHARHSFFDDRDTGARLIALSPSSVATTQAIERIRELKPKVGQRRVRLVAPSSENLNAVALHFSFGEFSAVLGSDLEETGNAYTGWSAVHNSNIATQLSLDKAHVYKVAHHGSETGHHQHIWEELLVSQPQAMTTPYSNCHLPKESDIERITPLASSFVVTRDPTPKTKTKRNSFTDRWLKRQTTHRHVINDKMGHVQIRITSEGEFSVAKNAACVEYRMEN